MGNWPERFRRQIALPKSMLETARLSVFEKESEGISTEAVCSTVHCVQSVSICARFDSQRVKAGFCFALSCPIFLLNPLLCKGSIPFQIVFPLAGRCLRSRHSGSASLYELI